MSRWGVGSAQARERLLDEADLTSESVLVMHVPRLQPLLAGHRPEPVLRGLWLVVACSSKGTAGEWRVQGYWRLRG